MFFLLLASFLLSMLLLETLDNISNSFYPSRFSVVYAFKKKNSKATTIHIFFLTVD